MLLGIAALVIAIGGGFLAGVLALAKATDTFNDITEGE